MKHQVWQRDRDPWAWCKVCGKVEPRGGFKGECKGPVKLRPLPVIHTLDEPPTDKKGGGG